MAEKTKDVKKVRFIRVHPLLAHSVGEEVELPSDLVEKLNLINDKNPFVVEK